MKLKKNIRLLITADGGAAPGKTTGAKMISKKYGLNFDGNEIILLQHPVTTESKMSHFQIRNTLKAIVKTIYK